MLLVTHFTPGFYFLFIFIHSNFLYSDTFLKIRLIVNLEFFATIKGKQTEGASFIQMYMCTHTPDMYNSSKLLVSILS